MFTRSVILRSICSYPLPTGGRSVVLVDVAAGEHPFALLDIPAEGPLPPPVAACCVVARLDDDRAATRIAVDHMLRSERLGYPADPARR